MATFFPSRGPSGALKKRILLQTSTSCLADKGSVQKAADAEKALKEGMQVVEALVRGNPSLTDADFVQCIGKLFVRVGLWSTNNMMKGDRRKGDAIG